MNLDFTPTFTPVLLRKDFDLGMAAAHDEDVPMPRVGAVHRDRGERRRAPGYADEDFAVLLLEQARRAGLELSPESVDVDDGLGASPANPDR